MDPQKPYLEAVPQPTQPWPPKKSSFAASSYLPQPARVPHAGAARPTPQEAARMANFVYATPGTADAETRGKLPAGWVPATIETGQVRLVADEIGFYSALYERPNANGTTTYAYVTRGTKGPHDLGEDMRQPLGLLAPQYNLSVLNARLLKALLGSELYFIGHSLGGGLASANALATGQDAITFNAAGLSRGTRRRNDLLPYDRYVATGGRIDAYVLSGEGVSRLQSVSVQQILLVLLRPVLGSEMPRLRQSVSRHGLQAEGIIHELTPVGLLTGRNAASGEKNRFYRLPGNLSPAEIAQLRAQQSRLTNKLARFTAAFPADRLPVLRTLLDIVNFFLGAGQSTTHHFMNEVEALVMLEEDPSLLE